MSTPIDAKICETCKQPENFPENSESELRPYGVGGALICYRCAFATPDSTHETERAFEALLGAAEAVSPVGVAVLGDGSGGPTPFDPSRSGVSSE